MKIRIITVGRIKPGPFERIGENYFNRLKKYGPIEFFSVREQRDILRKIRHDDFLIVCDERGDQFTSEKFAQFIKEQQLYSTKSITFVMGPAEGWIKEIKERARMLLSFSKFTIQHDLAAIVLFEQLYRAFTIIRGEPYHK